MEDEANKPGAVTGSLRPAQKQDQPVLRGMIRRMRLNPFGVNWQHFVVTVDAEGTIIGCGQVKTHQDGTRELASLAVEEAYRRRGIARSIIQHLQAENPPPLYLICMQNRSGLYPRFGFRAIEPDDYPPYFRRIWRLFRLLKSILHPPPERHMVVMRWDG